MPPLDQKLFFSTPILWFQPRHLKEIKFETVKCAVFTLAEFYWAYDENLAVCVKQDQWQCIAFWNEEPKSEKVENEEAHNVAGNKLYASKAARICSFQKKCLGISIAIVAVRLGSYLVVRKGKEPPALFYSFQTPLEGWKVHALAATVVMNIALATILTVIKIYLRSTHTCHFVKEGQLTNKLPDIPAGEPE